MFTFRLTITLFITTFVSFQVQGNTTNNDSLYKLLTNSAGIDKLIIYRELNKSIYKLEPERTIELSLDMLQLAQQMKNDSFKAIAYNYIGSSKNRLGKYDEAILAYRKSLINWEKAKDSYRIARQTWAIGNCFFADNNLDSALFYFEEAFDKYGDINDLKEQAGILNKIGIVYRKYGEYDKAILAFEKAIKIHDELNNNSAKASILNSIGAVYSQTKDFKNALKFYSNALVIRKQNNNQFGIAGSYNNIASVYMQNDSLDHALEYFFKALAINNEIGNNKWKAFNLHNIGVLYDLKKQPNKALEYLEKSIEIKEQLNDLKGLASSYNSVGFIYTNQGKYHEAVPYIQKCLDIGTELKHRYLIVLAAGNLADVYEKLNDYEHAFESLKLYSLHKDTLSDKQKVDALAEFEAKYETEKKAKENEILKYSLDLAEQKDKSQKTNLFFLIIGIVAISLFSIFLIYSTRLRRKTLQQEVEIAENKSESLNKQLEFRNRELASNAMFLAQNNELINKIITDVTKLDTHTSEEGKKIILKLIRELKKNSQDNAWKEFETRFENVHSEFYKNLTTNHPDLTPNERKLCAFLRLNMSTKDIAAITYQSIRGIETARLRLRKKLGITSETNLINYLSKF